VKINRSTPPASNKPNGLRRKIHEVIFEADTPAGKTFDVILIISILASVAIVMLDSIETVSERHGDLLYAAEWFFTILFTLEFLLRLSCVGRPMKYAGSFFGIVDLLGTIPTYIGLLFPGTRFLLVIRLLRVLRVFRILKLVTYVSEIEMLRRALAASSRKIMVFLFTIVTVVVIIGSAMYLIEGAENGFTSIPRGIYWAIVTLTTVGYGDLAPKTDLGQIVASMVMILGYSVIAVPTGIVTAEMTRAVHEVSTQSCPECSAGGHDPDAQHCKYCGSLL
jgi:voltage-gated potassium channel